MGDVTRRSVSGRPKVTTLRQDRYLAISARRQRGSIAKELGSALTIVTGIRISRQTVYRKLNHAGLHAFHLLSCNRNDINPGLQHCIRNLILSLWI